MALKRFLGHQAQQEEFEEAVWIDPDCNLSIRMEKGVRAQAAE